MNENEARKFIQELQNVSREEAKSATSNYLRVTTGTVISVSGDTATIRLAYAPSDGSGDFIAPIITRQTISVGDAVNIAYWCNLSTAVVLSK